LVAPPDMDSTRADDYWAKISLCQYAVMRATSAPRLTPVAESTGERNRIVWRSLRAGLAEGVRNSPLVSIAQHVRPEVREGRQKRPLDEEVIAARLAPPGQRIRQRIALM
jgi:hypothetical protein